MTDKQFIKAVKDLDLDKRTIIHDALDKVYWAIRDLKRTLDLEKMKDGETPNEVSPKFNLCSPIYHIQREILHERYTTN